MNNPSKFNQQIQLSIALKLGQIQKENLPNLSYAQFEEALCHIKWSEGLPEKLHAIIQDIFECNGQEIMAYLTNQAIIEGKKKTLADFESLIGG
jgi:hypothetical protein